jgi:hypothetical protein
MLEFVLVDSLVFGLELLKVPAFDCLAQCHGVVPCSGTPFVVVYRDVEGIAPLG